MSRENAFWNALSPLGDLFRRMSWRDAIGKATSQMSRAIANRYKATGDLLADRADRLRRGLKVDEIDAEIEARNAGLR